MQAIIELIKNLPPEFWVEKGTWFVCYVLFPAIGVLVYRAKGRDKVLKLANSAFWYVEAIAKATPGKVDDKLAEGLRVALAIAGGSLSEKVKGEVAEELGRLAEEEKKTRPSLQLNPNSSTTLAEKPFGPQP